MRGHILRGLALLLIGLSAAPSSVARPESEPLRTLAAERGFYVGTAVAMTPFRNEPVYKQTIVREFNACVAENAFKFANVHPKRRVYDFADTDALVEFAEANGMKLRGHTLVWHQQIPKWVTRRRMSRKKAISVMREHIQTLVGRYRGQVWAWDVVNEAVEDDGSGLRKKSYWYKTIGPDYIDMAFEFAHEADPDALLYYNDYGAEGTGPKANAVYELVSGLKLRGVPIDGVGWQMHVVNGFRTGPENHANAQRLAALGLELSVTELDVRILLPVTPEALATQAESYRDVAAFCLSEPAFKALVMWGYTDKYSWIPQFFPGYGAALPLDAVYATKPAYTAMAEAFAATRNFAAAGRSRAATR